MSRDDGKSLVKIIVSDTDKASMLLNIPQVRENKAIYMSNDEIANSVKTLVDNDVSVYRVKEDSSLEDLLVAMIEGDNK